jgi:hypothetical protein
MVQFKPVLTILDTGANPLNSPNAAPWSCTASDHKKWGWLNDKPGSLEPLKFALQLPKKKRGKHRIFITYLKSYEHMG